ncbi:MAG: protein phosphatase 2C domain-containing protein [Gammaproteobacteria bacterium]|nr:protein phosphatase 2C domain-containing protein [Gammaproteobacteria bacterium]
MKYETAQSSRLGNRKTNQDRCLVLESPDSILLALADGMGGHPKGEQAAQILIDTGRKAFLTSRKPISNPRVFLNGLMDMAHQQILAYGQAQSPPIEPRTTGVLCLVQENNVYWAHIGDSRLYIMHEGVIALRTDDHSYVEHLRQQGVISSAQTQTHRFRNYVTRCLGGSNNHPIPDFSGPYQLEEGDTILLCTDGFWSALPERPLVDALYKTLQPLAAIINTLSAKAEQNSHPESDNVTVIALRWQKKTINLEPTDISMSLTDNAAAQIPAEKKEEEVQRAISELRHLLEDFENEE